MMIATPSATSAAHHAFILMPPSRTNSVTSGSTATSDDHPSEFPTGSSTCLYMWIPPSAPQIQVPGPFERKRTMRRSTGGLPVFGPRTNNDLLSSEKATDLAVACPRSPTPARSESALDEARGRLRFPA